MADTSKRPPFARVDEDEIRLVVEVFYSRAREDDLLGPVFLRHVEDWPSHFAKLSDFWSSVLNLSGRYDGSPMQAHAALGELQPRHFARWLELFDEALADTVDPRTAQAFSLRARAMAEAHHKFLFSGD